jgi:hypothetical protein
VTEVRAVRVILTLAYGYRSRRRRHSDKASSFRYIAAIIDAGFPRKYASVGQPARRDRISSREKVYIYTNEYSTS